LISGCSVAELDFDDRTAIKAARLAGDGENPRHADQIGVPRVMFSGEVQIELPEIPLPLT
jgi:hypothetical protein